MKNQNDIRPLLSFAVIVIAAFTLSACAGALPGAIAYQRVSGDNSQVYVMDPAGEVRTGVSREDGWNFMPSWSSDGEKVSYYYFNPVTQMTAVYMVDVTQSAFEQILLTDTATYDIEFGTLKWSPADDLILYYSIDSLGIADIYKIDVVGRTVEDAFAESIYNDYAPDWSPDGTQFAFASNRPDKDDPLLNLYLSDAVGENLEQLTDNNSNGIVDTLPVWSPDGQSIAFWRYNPNVDGEFEGGPEGLWLIDLGSRETTLLYESQKTSSEHSPVWSPDGDYLAFLEDVDGQQTLRVLDVKAEKLLDISLVDGDKRAISWSPDSKALVFSNFTDPGTAMYILTLKTGELVRVFEQEAGVFIGDPHWGGR